VKQCCRTDAHRHLVRELAPSQPMKLVVQGAEEVVGNRLIAALGGRKK